MTTNPISSLNVPAAVPAKFKPFIRQTIVNARQWEWIPPEHQEAVQVVSHVLPFRTNEYVLDHLIDWNNIPDDPIYRLVFPHKDMLAPEDYAQLRDMVLGRANGPAMAELVRKIRMRMNPHPAGQMTHNVPRVNDAPVKGLQHKYKETVLFFQAPARPATPIAPSASAGRSSSAWTT